MNRVVSILFALIALCTFALGQQTVHHTFQTLPLGNGSFKPMTVAYTNGVPHQTSVYHDSKDFTVERFHGPIEKLVGVRILYSIAPTTFFGGEQLTSVEIPYLAGTTGVAEFWSLAPWKKHSTLAGESGYWSDRGRWVAHSDAPEGNPDLLVFSGFGSSPTYRHSYYVGASNVAPFDGELDFQGPSAYAGHAGVPTIPIELKVVPEQLSEFTGEGTRDLSYAARGWIELYAWDAMVHFYQASYAPWMTWESALSPVAYLVFDILE